MKSINEVLNDHFVGRTIKSIQDVGGRLIQEDRLLGQTIIGVGIYPYESTFYFTIMEDDVFTDVIVPPEWKIELAQPLG